MAIKIIATFPKPSTYRSIRNSALGRNSRKSVVYRLLGRHCFHLGQAGKVRQEQ